MFGDETAHHVSKRDRLTESTMQTKQRPASRRTGSTWEDGSDVRSTGKMVVPELNHDRSESLMLFEEEKESDGETGRKMLGYCSCLYCHVRAGKSNPSP